MARIPEYFAQTPAQGGLGGRQATAADFSDGEGLATLGTSIQGVADQIEQRQSEDDVTNVRLQVMKQHAELTKRFQEESLKAPAGDPEFANRFETQTNEYLNQGRSVAQTRKGQQTYDLLSGELTKHFAIKAGEFQVQSAGVKAKQDFTQQIEYASNSLINDPFSYGIVRQLTLATINDPDSTYARKGVPKEALVQMAEQGLAAAYIEGLIQNDHPEFARRELMSGKYDSKMEPKDKLRLVREADGKIKLNESKREHFDVKDIANAAVNEGSAVTLESQGKAPTTSVPRAVSSATQGHSPIVQRYAASSGVDANVLLAQIDAESSGNPNAVSPAGARGVSQFIPDTAKRYGVDVTNVESSISGQSRYMADLLKMFGGDYQKALAGYNWGEGNVAQAVAKYGDQWLSKAPAETRNYVSKIMTSVALPVGTNKDIRAGVDAALAAGDKMVIERYGDNPEKYYRMRDAVRHDILNYVNIQANVLASKQNVAHDEIMRVVVGAVEGAAKVTTQEQLFTIPGMLDRFKMLPGTTQAGIIARIDSNASAAAGKQSRVNSELEQRLFYRMTLPPTDPQAITRPEQITAEAVNGLHAESDSRLKAKLQELKTPEGKAFMRKLDLETRRAERFMRSGIEGDILFKLNPESFADAVLSWRIDTEQRIEDIRAKGGDTAKLLDPASPDYVGKPTNIKRFLPAASDVTAAGAAAVQAGRPPASPRQTVAPRPIVGTVRDGYEFLGGDPAKPESWRKVK